MNNNQITHIALITHFLKMVKNTTGGSSHKRFARKNQSGHKEFSWDTSDPSLIEVSIVKPLGDCRFQAQTKDRVPLLCHISSKYSGRNKHQNMVTANCIILASLRMFENPYKHCDYIKKLRDATPSDFFTTRLDTDPTNAMDADAFIFSNATMPQIQESHVEEQTDDIMFGKTIDFDSI